MKTKGIIFGALTSIFSLLIIVPMCIGNWIRYVGDDMADTVGDALGMFNDWSNTVTAYEAFQKDFPVFWTVLIQIAVIVALVAGVAYLILYVLDLAKVTKPEKTAALKNFLSIIMLVAGIVVAISGIIFIITNALVVESVTLYGFTATAGFYLACIFPILAGICGLLGADKAKSKRK